MDQINTTNLKDLFVAIAATFAEHEDDLWKLDALLGDGDLGNTMRRGYDALPAVVEENSINGLGKTLMKCGMTFSSVAPSTMGFLMASGWMSVGKEFQQQEAFHGADTIRFITAFKNGIVKRGHANPGDCTILDAFVGAEDALLQVDRPDLSLAESWSLALKGSQQGLELTKEMEPRHGKAAVLKDKAKGVVDPGAQAGTYLIEAIQRFVSK